MPSKDGSSQRRVNLLGAHITQLAVQDELIALGAQVHGGLLAEEDEGENVAVL